MTDEKADQLISAIERLTTAIASSVIGGGSAPAAPQKRYDEAKGPTLSTTGEVQEIRPVTIKKGKRAGDTMWFAKLRGGFEIGLFAEKNMLICQDARDSGRAVVIEYRQNGKYNDLVSIGFAPGQGAAVSNPADEEEETPF